MPFDQALRSRVDDYATAHLPGDLTWHTRFFDFLHCDPTLERKLGEMFYSTRYLYKILEGLAPGDEDWALETEVRLQVLNYASIYEACLHHLLFEEASSEPEVLQLTRQRTLRPFPGVRGHHREGR
ncbi:hypothetical protein JS562_54165 [Agrobacterium sp. S2]|nr:hypothetical protein [Agrobacterium sp. S2]